MDRSRAWAPFVALALALVTLNMLGLFLFSKAHPADPFAIQVWEYTESELARLITVSLILPMLLLALERKFKIVDTIEQRDQEREKERTAAERDRARLNRESRAQSVELVSGVWLELLSLCYEIAYATDFDDESRVSDLNRRLEIHSVSEVQTITMWETRFPIIPDEHIARWVSIMTLIWGSAHSVLIHGSSEQDGQLRVELQLRLVAILDWGKGMFASFMSMLSQVTDQLDASESEIDDGSWRAVVENYLARNLTEYDSQLLRGLASIETPVLASATLSSPDEAELLIEPVLASWQDWAVLHPEDNPLSWSGIDRLEGMLSQVSFAERGYATTYSVEDIRALSDRVVLSMIATDIAEASDEGALIAAALLHEADAREEVDEALAAYDEVVRRFGDSDDTEVRVVVAAALGARGEAR
jgi:hypothetical protein